MNLLMSSAMLACSDFKQSEEGEVLSLAISSAGLFVLVGVVGVVGVDGVLEGVDLPFFPFSLLLRHFARRF